MDNEIQDLKRRVAQGDADAQLDLDRKLTRAAIPQPLYIIVELGWNYNDQYYYPSHSENGNTNVGNPVLAYRDIKMAQLVCEQKNFESFKALFVPRTVTYASGNFEFCNAIGEYYDDWNVSDDWDNIPQEVREKFGLQNPETLSQFKFARDASDEDIKQLADCLSLKFFIIEQVDFFG